MGRTQLSSPNCCNRAQLQSKPPSTHVIRCTASQQPQPAGRGLRVALSCWCWGQPWLSATSCAMGVHHSLWTPEVAPLGRATLPQVISPVQVGGCLCLCLCQGSHQPVRGASLSRGWSLPRWAHLQCVIPLPGGCAHHDIVAGLPCDADQGACCRLHCHAPGCPLCVVVAHAVHDYHVALRACSSQSSSDVGMQAL